MNVPIANNHLYGSLNSHAKFGACIVKCTIFPIFTGLKRLITMVQKHRTVIYIVMFETDRRLRWGLGLEPFPPPSFQRLAEPPQILWNYSDASRCNCGILDNMTQLLASIE